MRQHIPHYTHCKELYKKGTYIELLSERYNGSLFKTEPLAVDKAKSILCLSRINSSEKPRKKRKEEPEISNATITIDVLITIVNQFEAWSNTMKELRSTAIGYQTEIKSFVVRQDPPII